jgi:hypothetical protein
MKMRIVIVAVLAFLVTANGFAQEDISLGVRAGVNFQNLTGKYSNGDKYSNKLIAAFNGGANVEIPVATDFYVQPGLLFSTKGAKTKDGLDSKINLSYLELPVNFLYKPELGNGKLLIGFGPYAALAVGGKYKIGSTKTNVVFGKDPGKIKRLDAGANFLAGYEFSNKLSFQLNSGLGLVNLTNRTPGDGKSSLKNVGFGVSAGYRFN